MGISAKEIKELNGRIKANGGGGVTAVNGQPYQAGRKRRRSKSGEGSADTAPSAAVAKEMKRSPLERKFADQWRVLCPDIELLPEVMPVPEVAEWRADFAIPEIKVMIEIDGGQWKKDAKAHGYGRGAERDAVKQNAAILAGWRVFRFVPSMMTRKTIVAHMMPIIELARRELGRHPAP